MYILLVGKRIRQAAENLDKIYKTRGGLQCIKPLFLYIKPKLEKFNGRIEAS